jgi:hypothetical protein
VAKIFNDYFTSNFSFVFRRWGDKLRGFKLGELGIQVPHGSNTARTSGLFKNDPRKLGGVYAGDIFDDFTRLRARLVRGIGIPALVFHFDERELNRQLSHLHLLPNDKW